jgi:predicted HTH transcriptional regulator
LLLGVDENGGRIDVTGIDDPRATADNVQSVCAELEPALRPRVSLIAHDGGKTVVVAEVPPVPRDMRPAIVRQSALTKARSSASATPTSR